MLKKNPFKQSSWVKEEPVREPSFTEEPAPSGSTIPRAPAHGSVADVIEKHGADSPSSIRAMKETKDSYVPLPHSYWNVDASMFELRVGPNYKKKKLKQPSGPALYDLYAVDIVKANSTLKEVGMAFKVPDIPGLTDIDTGHPRVPPMLVLNCNLPSEEPDMLKQANDGSTYVVVIYLVISPGMLEELRDFKNASPAAKLFVQWCEKAETNFDFRSRFKAMCVLDNIEKLGLPPFISGYNGKPTLISKSGTFTRHSNFIELSINVHMFAFLAKKGLYSLHKKFPSFVLNVGFTIEGRDDSELPEVLLGGARILNLDLSKVMPAR